MKKFYDPPAFSWPPYSVENDSPLRLVRMTFIEFNILNLSYKHIDMINMLK